MTKDGRFETISEYIADHPPRLRAILKKMNDTIKKAAPSAEEVISYNMPAFKLDGLLLYYRAHTSHLGFYPYPSAIKAFKTELVKYKSAKGSVQFPYDEPIPYSLVEKMVKFRVKENQEKAMLKKVKKK